MFRCTASLSPDKKHLVEAFNGARAVRRGPIARVGRNARGLPPRVAGILSLALNELVTNAAKHGALSVLAGRVAVHWHLEDPRRLMLEWREEGGPPVRSPRRRDFGRELIERVLSYELYARVDLQFATDGVRCRIAIPLGEETGLAVRAEGVRGP